MYAPINGVVPEIRRFMLVIITITFPMKIIALPSDCSAASNLCHYVPPCTCCREYRKFVRLTNYFPPVWVDLLYTIQLGEFPLRTTDFSPLPTSSHAYVFSRGFVCQEQPKARVSLTTRYWQITLHISLQLAAPIKILSPDKRGRFLCSRLGADYVVFSFGFD